MLNKPRHADHRNLWNRLARDLIYDAKQVLLYCGVKVPERKPDNRELTTTASAWTG